MSAALALFLFTAPFSIIGRPLHHWPWQSRAVAIESDPRLVWRLVQSDTAWVVTTKGDTIAVFVHDTLRVVAKRRHKP